MSIRSLIEINHDHISEFEQRPDLLGKMVIDACLERDESPGMFGVKRVWSRHHSEPCPVLKRQETDDV